MDTINHNCQFSCRSTIGPFVSVSWNCKIVHYFVIDGKIYSVMNRFPGAGVWCVNWSDVTVKKSNFYWFHLHSDQFLQRFSVTWFTDYYCFCKDLVLYSLTCVQEKILENKTNAAKHKSTFTCLWKQWILQLKNQLVCLNIRLHIVVVQRRWCGSFCLHCNVFQCFISNLSPDRKLGQPVSLRCGRPWPPVTQNTFHL